MTRQETEQLLRDALAEFAAAVDARPDLAWFRTRISADKRKAPADTPAEANDPRSSAKTPLREE